MTPQDAATLSSVQKSWFFIGLLVFVFFTGKLVARFMVAKDTRDQSIRADAPVTLDQTDAAQQAELDRLHRVDGQFDSRLDKMETWSAWLWTGLFLSLLSDLSQLWEAFFK